MSIAGTFGILAGAMGAAIEMAPGSPNAPGLLLLLFFAFSFFCVLVHELGHALAAYLVGWRVHLIVVSGLGYRVNLRKFVRRRELHAGKRAGWVLATPPPGRDWTDGWAIFIAGGSAANLTLAAISVAIAEMVKGHPTISAVLGGLAVASLSMAVANLVPTWSADLQGNDGAKLLMRALGRNVSDGAQAVSKVMGLWYDGVPTRDWDPELINQLDTRVSTEAERAFADSVLLNQYLAKGDVARAYALTERSVHITSSTLPDMIIQRAFLIGLAARDAKRADELLETIPDGLKRRSFQYWRALAVVQALRGEIAGARISVSNARKAAEKSEAKPDEDDIYLLSEIEQGRPVPVDFNRSAA